MQSVRTTLQPSVQGTLEDALSRVLGHPVRVSAAGRTDAGVHADGQVVSFATSSSIPSEGLARALAEWLPDDIWVVDAADAPSGFDARRSARRRWYRYAIWRGTFVPTLWHGRALGVREPLNLDAMRVAAASLVGQHDFAALATRPLSGKSTVRTVYVSDVLEMDASLLLFEICANAFLTHMVRAIVGGLLWVGTARWTSEQFITSLESRDRRLAGPNAPALGLTLHRIDY